MCCDENMLSDLMISQISTYTDEQIPSGIKQSKFPSYMSKWFMAARDEAFKSDFHTAKVGCVIVYKNHIIGYGHNQLKTDPIQKIYNNGYREWTKDLDFSKTCGHTIHAEVDAIKSIPYTVALNVTWSKVKVYVFRVAIGLDNYSGLSLPCPACSHALIDRGITKVYFTTGRSNKPFGKCEF